MSANTFNLNRNGFRASIFDNEILTQEDMRAELTKKKEKQITLYRKKVMKDLYTKMFSRSIQPQNNQNMSSINTNNNMEVEDAICTNNSSNNYNFNDDKDRKRLIQEYLNNEKNLYNELGEEFIYQIINDKKISFCPICGYPVIIIDKNLSNKEKADNEYVSIGCVNSCFQFELNEEVFNKYSMDNIMDLYVQALRRDNTCNHNDIAPITSGYDGVVFSCITCLFEQFK